MSLCNFKTWRLRAELQLVMFLLVEILFCADGEAHEQVSFTRDIRPILSKHCFACHGPDSANREAELRLDDEASAKGSRADRSVIVAGRPSESELIRRITSNDETVRMPPPDSGKQLSPEEIKRLQRWIAQGATWSLPWAYVAPTDPPLPLVNNSSWPKGAIDHFILARLESEGLRPSPQADKTTLIRRLHFDLLGLPPAPQVVDDFLADNSPDAYEELIDQLLASPHYGERMAMYWLDLVRYADTVGYHGDQEHHISPYRDWVINAFNSNMRFDQFTREQLAGDLLPDSTVAQRTASGYNRVLQTSQEGGVQPKEYLAMYAADHVRNLSAVWMAATVGCAQCHDHKYDPYTMRDFYSMAAFFADIDEMQHLISAKDTSPAPRYPELTLLTRDEEATLAALQRSQEQLAKQIEKAKIKDDLSTIKSLEAQRVDIDAQFQSINNRARRTMITVAIEPRVTRILARGNWMDESGEVVVPAVPAFLGKLTGKDGRFTRLDLANWLMDETRGAGGLTSRVMVNRFWYLAFGRGLAARLDDFGGQGEPPEHPELLNYLAREFIKTGWDMKHVMKLIVSSKTYQQSSSGTPELREMDPLNRLVARQGRFRVPAETVRDTALTVSGLLEPTVGGDSIRPYQPAGYYQHLNFPQREYVAHTDNRQWRRGVYMHWQRQFLHPMLKAFDAPSREECTSERPQSCTAPAALVLLNDPTFVEAARAFACRILLEGGVTTSERLDFAFRNAVLRDADERESALLEQLLARSYSCYKQGDKASLLLAVGLAKRPPHIDERELASWTVVARVVLNLGEVTTRN